MADCKAEVTQLDSLLSEEVFCHIPLTEIDLKEVEDLRMVVQDLTNDMTQLQFLYKTKEEENKELRERVWNLEDQLLNTQKQQSTERTLYDAQTVQSQAKVEHLKEYIQDLEELITSLEEKSADDKKSRHDLEKEQASLKKQNKSMCDELTRLQSQIDNQKSENNSLKVRLKHLQSRLVQETWSKDQIVKLKEGKNCYNNELTDGLYRLNTELKQMICDLKGQMKTKQEEERPVSAPTV